MATAAPPSAPPTGTGPASRDDNRRSYVIAALALGLVILVGVIAVAATTDAGPRQDTQNQQAEDGGAKPHIIPRPGDGVAPQNPGDRGGWEQLGLFGVMLASMAGIGVVIFRGGRRARTGRREWLAMASAAPTSARARTPGSERPSTVTEADRGPDAVDAPESS